MHLPEAAWTASPMGAGRRNLDDPSNQQSVLQIGLSKERWGVAGALDCSGAFGGR